MKEFIKKIRSTSFKTSISAKGIVFEEDFVWLRKNERNEWELPDGKLEKDEQPEETTVRELSEELGFKVEIVKIVDAYLYKIKKSKDEQLGVLVLSYLCKLISKTGTFEIEGEAGKAEFKKFKISSLSKISIPKFYKSAILKAYYL